MDLFTTVMICSMFHNNAIVNAIIKTDAGQNPYAVTVVTQFEQTPSATPPSHFKTAKEASLYAKKQLADNKHVNIGLMQIPSGWLDKLSKQGVALDDLWFPCKNVVIGSDLLHQSEDYCAAQGYQGDELKQCTLSFFETGDSKKGMNFANQILSYAATHPFNLKNTEIRPPAEVDYKTLMSSSEYQLPEPNFIDLRTQQK